MWQSNSKNHPFSLLSGRVSLLSWLIFLLGFIFVNNFQSLSSWLILFTYIFFILGWDLLHSLFFTFWASLLFRQFLIGTWISSVVAEPMMSLRGFSYSFGLQTAHIWTILLIFLMILNTKKLTLSSLKNGLKITQTQLILLSFLTWGLISSAFSSRLDLSLTGLVSLVVGGFVFLSSSIFFRKNNLKKEFKNFVLSSLLMLGVIGSLQYFLRHSLGLFIETRSSFSASEFLTTDGSPLYRVTGISPHPTFFASLLALFLLPVLGLIIDNSQKKDKFVFQISLTAFSLGLIALIATFSRSSWGAATIAILVMLISFFIKKITHLDQLKKLAFDKIKKNWHWVVISGLVVLPFAFPVLDRLSSFKTVWTLGNWSGRWELIKHSWQMILSHPFLGVGLNHFPAVMVAQGVADTYKTFIFPVHNTFLLFLSETGIVGGGLFIFFVILVLLKTRSAFKKSWFEIGIWLSLCTFIINAQFHTLFNQDPSFNIFMLFAGYLVANQEKA